MTEQTKLVIGGIDNMNHKDYRSRVSKQAAWAVLP